MNAPQQIDEHMRLGLGRGIRLKHDAERDAWTLMAPERVIVLDEIAYQVINEIVAGDGRLDLAIERLSQTYAAPREEISADVIEMLQPFVDKQLLRLI